MAISNSYVSLPEGMADFGRWSQSRLNSTGVFCEFWGFTAAVSGRIWTPYSPWSCCLPLHCWLPLVNSDQAPGSFSDVFWNLAHWGALNAQRFSMVFTIISMITLGWFEGVIWGTTISGNPRSVWPMCQRPKSGWTALSTGPSMVWTRWVTATQTIPNCGELYHLHVV